MTCSITFAKPAHGQTLAKAITVENGKVTSKRPSPNVVEFLFVEQEVCGLEDLHEAVVAGATTGWIVVRGKPKSTRGRRAIYPSEKGPAGLDVVARRWCAFDWDNLPLPVDGKVPDPLRDPEIGVALAMRRLPPPFRDVSCVWQISAGAGLAPGFRMRPGTGSHDRAGGPTSRNGFGPRSSGAWSTPARWSKRRSTTSPCGSSAGRTLARNGSGSAWRRRHRAGARHRQNKADPGAP